MPDSGVKRMVSVTLELDAELVEAARRLDGDVELALTRGLSRHVHAARRMTNEEWVSYSQAALAYQLENGLAGEDDLPV